MGKLFNIIGTSFALVAHFAANPIAHAIKRKHHRLILTNLAKPPKSVPLHNLQHVVGHCYAFDVEEGLIADSYSSATVILLEDDRPLKPRHVRDIPTIGELGRGTMGLMSDKLYFSARDSSSPLSNGRDYAAIHTPVEDPEKFRRLMQWAKATSRTSAARLAEMLAIVCPKHFSFASIAGSGPGVALSGLRIAIDSKAQLAMTAAQLSVEPAAGSTWSFTLRDVRTDDAALPPLTVRGLVEPALEAQHWIHHLEITGPDDFLLRLEITAEGKLTIVASRPDFLRKPLLDNFRSEVELRAWMLRVLDRLAGSLADGGFALEIDAAGRALLSEMLAPDAPPSRYVISTTTATTNRVVSVERLSLAD